MDNNNYDEGGIESSLTGMEKPCKLFITIDNEGFLMDSVAISDVVNFDCHESITRSAKRIIALFSNSKPEEIVIASLFYYKKRARSTRMNPVPLLTTTDGFRAVAEHPSGEVPLGVDWMKRIVADKVAKNDTAPTDSTNTARQTFEQLESSISKSKKTEMKTESSVVPEKKRKLDPSSNYKTYMPVVTKTAVNTSVTTSSSSVEDVLAKPEKLVRQLLITNMPSKEVPEEVRKSTSRNSKVNYHWTDNVTCEVVLSYDGVSERRKLPPDVSEIVQNFVKGDFSALKPELHKQLNSEAMYGVSERVAQELLNDANMNYPRHDKSKPIKLLNDAKLEIFRVMSLLQLSKARFKDLLNWMKTIKLEEGKQGKFYLSERNVIGGGLKVNYDTDELAAAKLNLIHKSRLKSNLSKVLHPVVSLPSQTSVSASKVDAVMQNTVTGKSDLFARPIMLMMPSTSSSVVTTSALPTHVHSGQSLIPLTVLQKHLQTPSGSSKDKESFSAGTQTFIVKNSTSLASLSSTTSTTTKTTTRKSDSPRVMKVPNILSIKSNSKSHKQTPPPDEPVPMRLYRSLNVNHSQSENGLGLGNDIDPTLPIIKQEPVDTNGDNSSEFPKTSDGDTGEGYHNVFRSDDRMLLGVDNPELDMELVIKTEPVDDYEN